MPKITVQVARQRYKRVPVIDPETGQPKRQEINRKRRKSDAPIYKTVMKNDLTQPLDPRKCERCGAELTIGEKYKSIGIKRQHGGIVRYRCMTCPTWQPWEYSNSLSARIQQIQAEELDSSNWTEEDDPKSRATEIAEMIRELAGEKEESADNMEEGFQHETEQSAELRQQAEDLNQWADDVEEAGDEADFPEAEEPDCGECEGTGEIDCEACEGTSEKDGKPCEACEGNGSVPCENCHDGKLDAEEVTEEQLEEWREAAADAIQQALDNCPI